MLCHIELTKLSYIIVILEYILTVSTVHTSTGCNVIWTTLELGTHTTTNHYFTVSTVHTSTGRNVIWTTLELGAHTTTKCIVNWNRIARSNKNDKVDDQGHIVLFYC